MRTVEAATDPSRAASDCDPVISGVRDLVGVLRLVSWFAAVGERITQAETTIAVDYLHRLGHRRHPVRRVSEWTTASAITRDPG